MLNDHQEEENRGFKIKAPLAQSKAQIIDDYDEDFIEEEIQSEQENWKNLAESGNNFGVTVSQSLGIDPSVDSLALDEYDHIEHIDM